MLLSSNTTAGVKTRVSLDFRYGAGHVDGGHSGAGFSRGSGRRPGATGSRCGASVSGFVGGGAVFGSFVGASGAILGLGIESELRSSFAGEGLCRCVISSVLYVFISDDRKFVPSFAYDAGLILRDQ